MSTTLLDLTVRLNHGHALTTGMRLVSREHGHVTMVGYPHDVTGLDDTRLVVAKRINEPPYFGPELAVTADDIVGKQHVTEPLRW